MIRYVHTNLIANDWKRLVAFYEEVFECKRISPDRDLSGKWLDQATSLESAQISGIHLQLPGFSSNAQTLEIFEYGEMPERPQIATNTPGFSHIAFAVDNVRDNAAKVIEHGGSSVGALTEKHIKDVGDLVFQYVADPEGNIIEIQSWNKIGG